MLCRKFDDLYSTDKPLQYKSLPVSRFLVTKIPNIQNIFCVDKYKILRLQRLTIREQDRQFVYGVTL